MTRQLLAIIVLVGLIPTSAVADEVQLRSGDRINGRAVQLTGGTLTLKTPHGDLKIPWTEVTALTVTQTLRVTLATKETRTIVPPITVTGGANAGFLTSSGNTDVNSLRLDGDAA